MSELTIQWMLEKFVPLLLFPIMAIIISCVYYYFAYGYFSVIVLNKLTKASFKLDITSIFDLFIAYFFALMVILVIYMHIPTNSGNSGLDSNIAIFLGFSLLYLGRIITKRIGVFYGKVHFTAIFLTSGVLILYRSIMAFGTPYSINPISLMTNFTVNSIDGIYYFISTYDYQILMSFSGAFFLSTLGEFILSMLNPTEHKLITIMEKMPSGFLTYTGLYEKDLKTIQPEFSGLHHGSMDKLDEILRGDDEKQITKIRCSVRSLWLIERINAIANTAKNGCEIYVIKPTDKQALFEYIDRTYKPSPSLDVFFEGREESVRMFVEKYIKRISYLKKYKTREYDLGGLAFLIFEYSNKERCLLFIVFDTGPRMNRVGLLTKEEYIIETFSNLFDSAWKIGKDYDPEKSEILSLQ